MKIFFFFIISVFLLIQYDISPQNNNGVSNPKSVKNNSKEFLKSKITCPECSYSKIENLPTEVCLIRYSCQNCNTVLYPKDGDCCVFCTYGTHKCLSKQ